MKFTQSQPKLIFPTRRSSTNKDQSTSTSTSTSSSTSISRSASPLSKIKSSRLTFIQKTKSFINDNRNSSSGNSSTLTPTPTPIPTQTFEKKGLSFSTKYQTQKEQTQTLERSGINENQILKQPRTPPTPDQPHRTKSQKQQQQQDQQSLDDGLAICLFGYSVQAQTHQIDRQLSSNAINESSNPSIDLDEEKEEDIKENTSREIPSSLFDIMYDSTYEEEVRQQAVMAEVLPDAEMWAKWEKTEAPLRQGRGWYPRLDRHFLELLVISEIHALSHPLSGTNTPPGQADRIQRHASRVRRVACERIGSERLNAYCERVREAFEAYMMGGWSTAGVHTTAAQQQHPHSQSQVEEEEDDEEEGKETKVNDEDDDDDVDDFLGDSKRGRQKKKGKGSVFDRNKSGNDDDKGKIPKINIIPSQETDQEGEEEGDDDESMKSHMETELSELKERSYEGSLCGSELESESESTVKDGEDKGMEKGNKMDLDMDMNMDEITYSSIVKDNKFLTLNKLKDS
ncbi:hypothetical protein L486_04724 [Kwoniella mangroviensis CBS 10435]|uniref:Uncharacterized protein n=1 Tax=Kwoniella mangroviensis CBS 10435 TaxID=1331196 RepID=A0A1B9INW5_9TREE|nr:hypothetical protein L486_04724 [Kwoniella mangroviensis CBS 10435]